MIDTKAEANKGQSAPQMRDPWSNFLQQPVPGHYVHVGLAGVSASSWWNGAARVPAETGLSAPHGQPKPIHTPAMLIRYFIEIPLPQDSVADTLMGSPETWIPGLVRGASDRGERLLTEVGLGERLRVSKQVEISLGEPRRLGEALYVPISWRATGPSGLFPVLEGDLEVAPLGEQRTHLAISARYTPPLDGIGRIADRAMLHRVAESTVKDFLDQIGDRLYSTRETQTLRP